MRILIVEDNPDDVVLVRHCLERGGISSDLTGEETLAGGIERVRGQAFDIVLLDLNLPDSSGKETFVRFIAHAAAVPIIVLSGMDEALALWTLQYGAQEYLNKDRLDPRSMANAIRYAAERKRMEIERAQAMRFLDAVIEHLPDMVFVKNARDLRFVRVNRAAEALLGFPREELLGKSDFDFFPEEQARFFVEKDREVLNGKSVLEIPEETIATRNLGPRVLRTRKVAILDANGLPEYLLGYAEDITEKKELEASQRHLAALVEQSNDAIYSVDMSGNVLSWNSGAERLFGFSRDEVKGRAVTCTIPEERFHEFESRWCSIAAGEYVAPYQTIRRRKDGSPVEVQMSVTAIKGARGETVGVSVIARDITEQNAQKRRLIQAYNDLKEAQGKLLQMEKLAVIGQFSAGIAHELKNPMAIALQGVNFLQAQPDAAPDAKREVIGLMLEAIRRGESIINRLLAIGKPAKLELRRVDPLALMRRAADLSFKACVPSGVEVSIDGGSEPQEVDEQLMTEALVNLITNALHAMPGGGRLLLKAYVAPDAAMQRLKDRVRFLNNAETRAFVFEVTDTGEGIDAQAIPKLFLPFYTTKSREKGTGLGLPLVQSIVESHGGQVVIESELGKGTSAFICLPLRRPERCG